MVESAADANFSKYVEHLKGEVKERYLAKCASIGVQDPYNLPVTLFKPIVTVRSPAEIPDVGYYDIYNYLVNRQSYFS